MDQTMLLNKKNGINIKKDCEHKFPSTRYQGSKLKLVDWIWDNVRDLNFDSAIDLFGGTGSVSYMLKSKGKSVIYNDVLIFNSIIGKALIENDNVTLSDDEINYILTKHDYKYPTFIADNFKDIFYLEEENSWLDYVTYNIRNLHNEDKKNIAYFALFQACIIKRPYNLFHRANLYVRTSDVKRGFGNKTTWDKSFEEHFRKFVVEANKSIFSNNKKCIALNYDAFDFPIESYNADLVYIDTPYINSKGVGTDYLDFYHFLEGIVRYDEWENLILPRLKHKAIKGRGESPWTNKNLILDAFDNIFEKFKDSILVISYCDSGIPSHNEIMDLLNKYKSEVIDVGKCYKYALSAKKNKEILIIAK